MKKKLILLCVLALLIGALAVSAHAAATGTPVITITPSKTEVNVSEDNTITFTVKMTTNPGVVSIQFAHVLGDSLEYVSGTSSMSGSDVSEGRFIWATSGDDITDQDLVIETITCRVKDTATIGSSDTFTIAVDTDKGMTAICEADAGEYENVTVNGATFSVTHNHTAKADGHTERHEPDCTTDGNIEYWTCSCGKNFSDENCTTEATDTVLTKTHTLTHHDATPSGCREQDRGTIEYWECTGTCKKNYSPDDVGEDGTTYVEVSQALESVAAASLRTHEQIFAADTKGEYYHEEKNATCTENGNIEYWLCPYCTTGFTDNKGDNSVEEGQLEQEATGHGKSGYKYVEKVPASMKAAGVEEHWVCNDCYKDTNITTDPETQAVVNKNFYFLADTEEDGKTIKLFDSADEADAASYVSYGSEGKFVHITKTAAKTDWAELEIAKILFSPGDMDDNGFINAKDYRAVLQAAADKAIAYALIKADVNADGFINAKDYRAVLQVAADKRTKEEAFSSAADIMAKWDEMQKDYTTGNKIETPAE